MNSTLSTIGRWTLAVLHVLMMSISPAYLLEQAGRMMDDDEDE